MNNNGSQNTRIQIKFFNKNNGHLRKTKPLKRADLSLVDREFELSIEILSCN